MAKATLSGLDASFLYLETPEQPMHVSSLCVYEVPPKLKRTFPKAVLDPLFVPTFPVRCEIPVLLTAPLVEKRTKLAAVPKGGACPKWRSGKDNNATVVAFCNSFFI